MSSARKVVIALVQHKWHPDPQQHQAHILQAVKEAKDSHDAQIVFLQELTLHRHVLFLCSSSVIY